MPRARLILQSEFPYNITARCINREWFSIPLPEVWKIFCDELAETNFRHKLKIHSFVLMSNHFHMIASTPDANIDKCMHRFMGRTSRALTFRGNRINQTFAGRHYKTILQHPTYFLNAYKYNYRNPVGAGICARVEEYPYSTLQYLLGKQKAAFPLADDFTFAADPKGTIEWLNTNPDPEKLEAHRYGVRHQYFRSKKHRNSNAPIITEKDLL